MALRRERSSKNPLETANLKHLTVGYFRTIRKDMHIGWTEILVILALILLLFGAKRLPELARALGKSLKEFKKGTQELVEDEKNPKSK